ncbi:hypothetical protein LUZ61_012278 [Rhynchospora tenuis]|uniref:Glycosyltransferase n=1 Tax=Rhynchospora tenuis TaxID=198213 RepID=A0AAD6A2R2_9POAL|nr:hypothetical protein LUZ61_012278 [Rhynchospora tenuis]
MIGGKGKGGLSPTAAFILGAASATIFLVFIFSDQHTRQPLEISPLKTKRQFTAPPDHANFENKVNNTSSIQAVKRTPKKQPHANQTSDDDQHLQDMLRKAALDDNTIIMTSVNEAWAAPNSLLDSFFESFRVGENMERFLKHIFVVALDEKAYQRCKSLHPYCYFLKQEGLDLSGAQSYMKNVYLDLVWSKLKLQQRILELGYNLLFTDVDVAWLRDPFEYITLAPHISTSSDFYFGNPDDLGNYPNTGFIYFKSCKKNIKVMDYWHKSRKRFPENHDQFVFNEIKHEIVKKFGVRMKFLDTAHISGFCQLGRDLSKIATVHMTCCIGLENKLFDLKRILEDWRSYLAHPQWERQLGKIQWRFEGGRCIH